jgi:hypothetical protein
MTAKTINHTIAQRALLLPFLLTAFVLCVPNVMAQSGRHVRRPAPAATPAPEPTPIEKSKPKEKSNLALVVGIQGDSFSNAARYYDGVVLRGCADRLRESSATVDVSQKDINRSEAIKLAKASKDAFVVFLKIGPSSIELDQGTYGNPNLSELYIEYVVFAPTTAKVAASGRSYQRALQKGPVVVGPTTSGRNNSIYTEQLLRQAAEDAAERILHSLHISLPGTTAPIGFCTPCSASR